MARDSVSGGLGLPSGIGLVVSNMVGAGVFVSAGFMAQELGPAAILAAWGIGLLVALAGARAYAAVATLVPRSGGEYRFLSELLHPALGYLAGWASLLLGFSAPIAIDALAAGAFARTLAPAADPRAVGAALIVALTALHAFDLSVSRWTQNTLVAVSTALLLGFVALGLTAGSGQWPTWSPPTPPEGSALGAFAVSLFYIAFAFSGWNAAVYAADEFRAPRRDVPRSLIAGCASVGIVYLLVNWVFVANLTPERARAVFAFEQTRVTLGHLVTADLIGPAGAAVMSVLVIAALVAAMSGMIFNGPRIYSAMAADGFLPRVLARRDGRPPVGSVLVQGALALVLLFTHRLQDILQNLGALLTLFTALTALSLFRVWLRAPRQARPGAVPLVAAAIHCGSAALMLYFGFRRTTGFLLWVAVVAAVALVAYTFTRARRRLSSA